LLLLRLKYDFTIPFIHLCITSFIHVTSALSHHVRSTVTLGGVLGFVDVKKDVSFGVLLPLEETEAGGGGVGRSFEPFPDDDDDDGAPLLIMAATGPVEGVLAGCALVATGVLLGSATLALSGDAMTAFTMA
jgi:hypothetical protein